VGTVSRKTTLRERARSVTAVERGRGRLGSVLLPKQEVGPLRQVGKRLFFALLALLVVVALVYLDRDGYSDVTDGEVSLLDAFYYATVTLSTTGYGDIAPVSPSARLVNIFVVTPLRILFLITLIGTTLEALTESSRAQFRQSRWRAALKNHTVVVGYGTKGRSAISALVANGVHPDDVVVVDPGPEAIAEATAAGFAGVVGDAARSEVLQRAEVGRASRVIVAVQRDDTAVLVTLTARKLNPPCTIVVAVREAENAQLLRQSGADSVVTSSDAAGRLLGLSTMSPAIGAVIEDLLLPGTGLEVAERVLHTREVGAPLAQVSDRVLGVVRKGTVHRYNDPEVAKLRQNDKLVFIRAVGEPHHKDGE
jgi:voltage-gated potassium channel